MGATTFQAEAAKSAAKLRESDRTFETKLQAIVQRDTQYQQALADRGGTMTSSLTDDAQAAANEVVRQRDKARRSHGL